MANGLGRRKTNDAQSRASRRPQLPVFKFFHAVAATTVCALILVGCTPEQKPTETPSVSASSTVASSAPSSTSAPPTTPLATSAYQAATKEHKALNVPVPVLPEKAKEFSKGGIEAFAKYWYQTLTYLYETGDSKPLEAITGPDCKVCNNAKSAASSWYASGGWIVGGQMIVTSNLSSFESDPNGNKQSVVVVRQQQVTYIRPDGATETQLPVRVAQADVLIASHNGRTWQANDVGKVG